MMDLYQLRKTIIWFWVIVKFGYLHISFTQPLILNNDIKTHEIYSSVIGCLLSVKVCGLHYGKLICITIIDHCIKDLGILFHDDLKFG